MKFSGCFRIYSKFIYFQNKREILNLITLRLTTTNINQFLSVTGGNAKTRVGFSHHFLWTSLDGLAMQEHQYLEI